MIILKWCFRLNFCCSRQGPLEGCCEHSDGLVGSKISRNFVSTFETIVVLRTVCFSSMSNSLSSMSAAAAAGSCLQQREHSSYPYMFHDPLHSLSSTYNHSAARAAAVSNPAVAHSQSAINTHAPYGGVTTSSTPATGTGKNLHACNRGFNVCHGNLDMLCDICCGGNTSKFSSRF